MQGEEDCANLLSLLIYIYIYIICKITLKSTQRHYHFIIGYEQMEEAIFSLTLYLFKLPFKALATYLPQSL
jgi:hypothetical protein